MMVCFFDHYISICTHVNSAYVKLLTVSVNVCNSTHLNSNALELCEFAWEKESKSMTCSQTGRCTRMFNVI